ncbi:MAG: hypothetical protein D3910_03090 [Candidatus Electrothrix sp. ATG2]|nr:hypothetical protein [Candidatus Electrothrix sp. ATG2]
MFKIILKNTFLVTLGAIIGIGVTILFYLNANKHTEIWSLQSDITLENGAILPKHTQLTLNSYMPEGYASLSLNINAEAVNWNLFEKKEENKGFLKIPYWVNTAQGKP